jgi:hypothetical protein
MAKEYVSTASPLMTNKKSSQFHFGKFHYLTGCITIILLKNVPSIEECSIVDYISRSLTALEKILYGRSSIVLPR